MNPNPEECIVWLQGELECVVITPWFHSREKQTLNLWGSKYKTYRLKILSLFPTLNSFCATSRYLISKISTKKAFFFFYNGDGQKFYSLLSVYLKMSPFPLLNNSVTSGCVVNSFCFPKCLFYCFRACRSLWFSSLCLVLKEHSSSHV